jgi:nucleoside phosphorylase/CheY-like chemotaxis protein
MKILIVDDNPRRYERLVSKLTERGLERDCVDIVTSAMDARHKLRETKYDLLIIDILLPLRPEDAPEERHSRELLAELVDTDELQKPRQIVGLSAYSDAAGRIAPFFRDRIWTVIEYSEQNDDWISQISNCVAYLHSELETPALPVSKVDVAIICALADPELRAIVGLPWTWNAARPIDDITFVHDALISISNGIQLTAIAASATRMGMVSTALLSAKIIEKFRPKVIVVAGICAGVRGKTNLGDAILIDPSWDYQSGKRAEEDETSSFAIAPHQIPVLPSIRSRFEQLKADRTLLSSISDGWPAGAAHPLRLIVGPVASGSAVLADARIMAEVRQQHRELCGVEMEAYGMYFAATYASSPRPIFFGIKSVCDFGESDKNDDAQRYAAYTSAEIVRSFIERYFQGLLT